MIGVLGVAAQRHAECQLLIRFVIDIEITVMRTLHQHINAILRACLGLSLVTSNFVQNVRSVSVYFKLVVATVKVSVIKLDYLLLISN